jgi:hypothetical protein
MLPARHDSGGGALRGIEPLQRCHECVAICLMNEAFEA